MKDKEIVGLYEAYQSIYSNVDEEVETLVNSLVEEGYDLSDYTWDDMVEIYMNEAMSKYDRNRQRAARRAAARNQARAEGKTGAVPGIGYVTPRRERETWTDERGQERHTSGARMPKKEDQKESFDLFDTIIKHLVTEGYADTNESALAIMANMSEDWKQSIVDETINEGRRTSLSALSRESQQRRADEKRGRPETQDEKHRRLRLGRYAPSQYNYEKGSDGQWKVTGRKDGEKD